MSTDNASPQTWRVVVTCDEVQPHTHVREVKVYHNHLGWFTRVATSIGLATPRAAVAEHAAKERWSVVEILAPGARTAAEEVAAERERLRAELAKVTNDARTTFLCNEIAAVACERVVDHNERAIRAAEALAAEVVRLRAEIERLTKERDDAILERMRVHQEAGLIEG
jgi:hypothetical protein